MRTKRKYIKHNSTRKAGVLKYIDELKPKNIKLKGVNDCGPQVFQLLQYTNKKNSLYFQNKLNDLGLHYQDVVDMLNKAYKKSTGQMGEFEWMQINLMTYIHDMNKYIKKNEGTILFVFSRPENDWSLNSWRYPGSRSYSPEYNAGQIPNKGGYPHYSTTPDSLPSYDYVQNSNYNKSDVLGHYVALFRKPSSKKFKDLYKIRDPQIRPHNKQLYGFEEYANSIDDSSEFWIVVNKNKDTLQKYKVTRNIIDDVIKGPSSIV